MKHLLFIFLLIFTFSQSAQGQKAAYQIYQSNGKTSSYNKLLKKAKKADIILFGELHDNPINHWLQLELSKDLLSDKLIMGAEMMESDNQVVVDEYLAGWISSKKLIEESKTWPNFTTDYLPLMALAQSNGIPFIATNIPRRYASIVYSHGLDTLNHLSSKALGWIAPLPIALDTAAASYQEMLAMGMGHGGDNLPKSQAIKDATMAHFILEYWQDGSQFIHFHGTFHSKWHEGICWQLLQQDPKLNILTIASHSQDHIQTLDSSQVNMADFILVTPTNMTSTK